VVDGNRCLSWVLQRAVTIPEHYRRAVHDRIYGCDDCQDVCPISVRLGGRDAIPLDATSMPWIDAVELLAADDDWILERCGAWYIADRDVRWLRRNALVVLGNTADPAAPADGPVRRTLDRYGAGPDPVLAEHAAWARRRLQERLGAGSPPASGP